jgi:hypothetical protein
VQAALASRAQARGALYLDQIREIDSESIHVRGWAHGGREPFERLAAFCDGREVGSALLGIARPDVRRVFPRLRSEQVGFVATFNLGGTPAAAVELELHGKPRGSKRRDVFDVQVTRTSAR